MKAYKVLGTTDDVTTCDLCGKPELKGTVVLAPLDVDGNEGGDVEYFGTSCAAKAAGWTLKEVRAGVKAAKEEAAKAERAARIAAREAETKAYNAWVAETYGVGATLKDAIQKFGVAGLWAQFRASLVVVEEPREVVKIDVPARTCHPGSGTGDIHFEHIHCVECNAFRMRRMSRETVEYMRQTYRFNQDEYEAYMHVWATSAVRHSAGDWATAPTDPKVIELVAAIRRHAGIPAPAELAA